MEKENKSEDDLPNYILRHRNWQNKSMDQLSFANSFLLTTSIAFFTYIFEKNGKHLLESSFTFLLFMVSFLSILLGFLVLISRLYDFRLTSHITLVRQRYYEKNKRKLTHKEFAQPDFRTNVNTIFRIIFVKINFLTKLESQTLKPDFDEKKFNDIRELSFRLGVISWRWTKLQALYFLLGIVLYVFYAWFK